jgi:hypothetical protein
MIPVLFLLLDLAVCILAVMINDSCARDAARAASVGTPQDYTFIPTGATQAITEPEDASKRYAAVVAKVFQGSGYITGPVVVPDKTGPLGLVAPNATTGGAWGGNYQVTTKITVSLPASLPGVPSKFDFNSSQQFPITKVEQSTPF